MTAMGKYHDASMAGIIPCMGIKEFFDKLHEEEYDENRIHEVWEKMNADPETKKLMQNNIECGVCAYDSLTNAAVES